jgi:hypothetical protein
MSFDERVASGQAPTAEEIVRRLGRRPGYHLLTYREVGLPFWKTPVRCRVLAKKDLPPLDEFVLRCVDVELQHSPQIAAFLGLTNRVVESVMGGLVASGHLVPTPPQNEGPLRYVLTERGRLALRELGEVVPVERDISVSYDGVLREYMMIDPTLRWRPRDLRERDVLEVPAFPADPPDVGVDDTVAIAAATNQIVDLADVEILSVLGLAGRREKFFIRAIALVFESIDDRSVNVHFAIDGRPSEKHDLAFARAEGLRKLGVISALREDRNVAGGVINPDLLAQRSDDIEIAALRRATEALHERVEELQDQVADADEHTQLELAEQISDLERRLEEAETALTQAPVRILEVQEHPKILREAISTAQDRLLIVSPWVRVAVVNGLFLKTLEDCLQRGVQVAIGYGIDDGREVFERDREAERSLLELAGRYDSFRLARLGDTHAKVLVVDRAYVVVTSFNWLSFRGDPNRPFRDERGTLVAVPEEVDRIYDDYMRRMAEAKELG